MEKKGKKKKREHITEEENTLSGAMVCVCVCVCVCAYAVKTTMSVVEVFVELCHICVSLM